MKVIFGIILICAGMILRYLAIYLYGGKFSFEVKPPERLITSGIYKYIRHPAYLGSILFIFGLSLISVEIGLLFVVGIFFTARAISEEQILSHFFKEYSDYQKKTGMFIPKFFRKKKEN